MKRIFLSFLLAAFSLAAAAQSSLPSIEELKDKVEEHSHKPKKTADFVLLDYLGYGFHGVQNADPEFGDHTAFLVNREIYFNLFGFVLRPGASDHHAFTLGVDLDWDNYRLDDAHMWMPANTFPSTSGVAPLEGAVLVGTLEEAGMQSKDRSILRVLSFDIPLDYTFSAGDLAVTLGAAAQISFPGRTRFVGTDLSGNEIRNTKSGKFRVTDIKTNTLTWNAHAQVTYLHLGIYGEYSPQPVFQKWYGPQFSTWTVGLIIR